MLFCLQGVSMTTLRRRRAKSLEGLQQGSARLTGLKEQVHQAWSIASSWQALIDQADDARVDAVRQLQSTNLELQVCSWQEESTAVDSSSVASVSPCSYASQYLRQISCTAVLHHACRAL